MAFALLASFLIEHWMLQLVQFLYKGSCRVLPPRVVMSHMISAKPRPSAMPCLSCVVSVLTPMPPVQCSRHAKACCTCPAVLKRCCHDLLLLKHLALQYNAPQRQSRGRAAGQAIIIQRCAAVPWTLCALIFTGLYLTYSRDKAGAQLREAAADQKGRLVQRNGFLRLESNGDVEENGSFDQKWQLLRTTPAQH